MRKRPCLRYRSLAATSNIPSRATWRRRGAQRRTVELTKKISDMTLNTGRRREFVKLEGTKHQER